MSWNDDVIEEFRANGGIVGGGYTGKPLLLLHHVGARTGTGRVSPLMYQAVDGGYAVFASKAGADHHPGWYYNLLANPVAKVEVGVETVAVEAREIHGDQYERIWERQKSDWPQFVGYEDKTSRDRIPALLLEPI